MLSFIPKGRLGAMTRGTYNRRFQVAIRTTRGAIILANHGERTHEALRQRHPDAVNGEEGYVWRYGGA